jgi:hypothetical protein
MSPPENMRIGFLKVKVTPALKYPRINESECKSIGVCISMFPIITSCRELPLGRLKQREGAMSDLIERDLLSMVRRPIGVC